MGNSILRLEDIFEKEEETIVLVEDSMAGFRRAKALAKESGKKLVFGLRLDTNSGEGSSKVVFFAKNNEGVDSLRRIYTKAKTSENQSYKLEPTDLVGVEIAIPFYDSFLHKGIHNFGSFELDLPYTPTFFAEDNRHPYDYQIRKAIERFGGPIQEAKTILYDTKEDFVAFQFYKSVCNRKIGRASPTFDRPELEGCCSDEFCYESFKEK